MLEKPVLPDQLIIDLLQESYGLTIAWLDFLPIGADFNTAVYRGLAADGAGYFVKLRKGDFAEITVRLPHYLHAQGLQTVVAPLESKTHALSVPLSEYRLILYPYIAGADGYTQDASHQQWIEFGAALQAIHSIRLPPALLDCIPGENFSPCGRNLVRLFQSQVAQHFSSHAESGKRRDAGQADFRARFTDPVAARLAAFMYSQRQTISRVVDSASQLAQELQRHPLDLVLCHADIHPGNLHLTSEGALYLVDWDNPILAPKERDLALIGGCFTWSDPEIPPLFYQGYRSGHRPVDGPGNQQADLRGSTPGRDNPLSIDPVALAYYRLERIVQDLAAFGEQLLLSAAGGEDREQSLYYFTSNFLPGHEIELAFQALPGGLPGGGAAETG